MQIISSCRLTGFCILSVLSVPDDAISQTDRDSLFSVIGDEGRTVRDRLSAYADLVYFFEHEDPAQAIHLGKEGLILAAPDSLYEDLDRLYVNLASVFRSAARQHARERSALARWLIISISSGIFSVLLIVFILYYIRKSRQMERFRDRLQQRAVELDILRFNIAHCHSHNMLPFNYTLDRQEVNSFLRKALSERELDVFMLLLEEKTNKSIANELFVSVNTVKFHLQNIYVKLNVGNRTDAILSVGPEYKNRFVELG